MELFISYKNWIILSENDINIQTTNTAQPNPGPVIYVQQEKKSKCIECCDAVFCCCEACK